MKGKVWLLGIVMLLLVSSWVGAQPFGEAPMLQELVAAGELPPVEERLPKEPLVVEPVEGIGRYGGTLRVSGIRPVGWGDDHMVMDTFASMVMPTADGGAVVPHFAKDVQVSEDATTWTIWLREGVKWSDGHPFTTEDIVFWYEDILLNEDLTPAIGSTWRVGPNVFELNVIDDYTFEMIFAGPRPFFINELVHSGNGMVNAKHYLKQFHPNHTPIEEVQAIAEAQGFQHWYELFGNRNQRQMQAPLNPDAPTISSYHLVEITSDRRVWERNPYYWNVDTAGNQLPYIDRIETQIASDREVISGMIISGAVDFAAFENDIRNYPMYRNFEDEGNYRTILWSAGYASDVIINLNLSTNNMPLREIFNDVRFRQALSLGIDRDEINEIIYFGRGVPMQYTVLPGSPLHNPEFAKAFIEFDPERANALLDEVGLDQRGPDGYRLFPSGEHFQFTFEVFDSETPKGPNMEIIIEQWRELGLDIQMRYISGELQGERAPANLMDATVWHGDRVTDVLFFEARKIVPIIPHWGSSVWPAWERYFHTQGRDGEEPPDIVKEHYNNWAQMVVEPDPERRLELGREVLRSQAENLWVIGVVGLSPYPVVINNDLRNVPEQGLWVWDTAWMSGRFPSTFYLDR